MATTDNQGFLQHTQASGSAIAYVFASLLSDLDSLLRGRNKESFTVSDGGKVALNGGVRTESVVATIINQEDGEAAQVLLDADNTEVNILSQTNATFGTTEGNDTTTNVYYDSGNTRFELNNEKGGERTYDVTIEGE